MASGIVEGGGSLSDVYSSAKRILLKARDGIERLERFESSSMDSPDLASSVKRDITEVRSLCSNMDTLWRSIPVKSQRDLWRRKTEQVGEEAEYLNLSLEKYMSRNQRKMLEAKERADLLGRASGEGAHILQIFDEEAQAMSSVKNSKRMLEESFSSGVAILSKYAEQRDRLKSAQRKALDVLNTVGLSNSVLRLIERRNRVDTWIKYAAFFRTAIALHRTCSDI
ncbi:membrin 11 [Arabidopsis thaliana]|uniref:Membrin n=1 Tax=Arabidopsis thaliana TaxID=3702 RepID=A0A1P8AXF4_ARATH|nr:membrin 11 [Arabidopsis thaliana]ANM61349.1 membrin 11 [Arabidopsis thaliana]|eukprot:NP_001323573.1 membrin 11 [Arabidopsis thaliana]